MAVYRRSRRHRFLLVLLVLTSITVITVDYRGASGGALDSVRKGARDALAPIQNAASRALEPVGNFFGGITKYRSLQKENARLRSQLDQAKGDALTAAGATRERDAIADLLKLGSAANIPGVAARVVSTSPSNFQDTVVIDRGSNQKVAVGMPVVNGAGLVGRIIDVTKTRATIELITDRSSNVGVRLTGSGAVGVAAGDGSSKPLKVGFVPSTARVADGEAVVTSGLQGSAFPPEIPVGRVHSTAKAPGAIEQEITVDVAADLPRLEFVKVLLWGTTGQP